MKTTDQMRYYRGQMLSKPSYHEKIIRKILKPKYKPKVDLLRQAIIGTFIVDFLVVPKLLIIEFDGKIHDDKVAYDRFRDSMLKSWGFNIVHVRIADVPNIWNIVEAYPDVPDYKTKYGIAWKKGIAHRNEVQEKKRAMARAVKV